MAAARASWKGHLKLALLSCPIRLYKATGRAERLSGHFLHKDTRNRISMIPHDPQLGRIDRSDMVMGYDCGQDGFVILSDADLKGITNPSDKTLLIESFVDGGEVDPIYLDQPYYLAPDGAVAIEMLDVLRGAMSRRKRAAVTRLVMNQRERLAVLTVRSRGFLLTTLLNADEVREPEGFYQSLPNGDPSIELLNLAEQLIAIRFGRFDPHIFKDRYQAALQALIEQKLAYGETTDQADQALSSMHPPAANDDELQPPADLVEAFRQSLDHHLKAPAASHTRRRQARKKTTAKTSRVPEKSPG